MSLLLQEPLEAILSKFVAWIRFCIYSFGLHAMTTKSLTATLKYATVSEKKIALIAKIILGKPVDEALPVLQFLPKKAAKILRKLVRAAQANASHNLHVASETLRIKTVDVGRGPKIKRVRSVGRSRMHGYVKHRSFVRVVLDPIAN